jgi:hypothetical protein
MELMSQPVAVRLAERAISSILIINCAPGQGLFDVNGTDPNLTAIYNTPEFRRMYWRALNELVRGPLDVANSGPLLDAKYSAFIANGLNVQKPDSL